MNTKEERLEVVNTILQQLGGNRFIVMTGAKQFVAIELGLMLTLPARLAKLGINKVRVELDASNTYTMTTLKVNARRDTAIEVQREMLIHCYRLEATFEGMTDVYTRF